MQNLKNTIEKIPTIITKVMKEFAILKLFLNLLNYSCKCKSYRSFCSQINEILVKVKIIPYRIPKPLKFVIIPSYIKKSYANF